MRCNIFAQNGDLYDLCQRASTENVESWMEIRLWLRRNKKRTRRFKAAATYSSYFFGDWTPLHIILSKLPPIDVVETIIEIAPKTLRCKSNDGFLPLHIACMYRASPDIVRTMVKAYPDSVKALDYYGSLPLHSACSGRMRGTPSLEVLDILLKAYPEGFEAKELDHFDKPSGILRQKSLQDDQFDSRFLLHTVCANGFSVYLVNLLLAAFPDSCMIRDSNGRIPLHHACSNSFANGVDIVKALLNANPESSIVLDNQGRSPMQIYQKLASSIDRKGMLLLHHQVASSIDITTNFLQFLVSSYPEGIALQDYDRMLPFHHACLNRNLSLNILVLLLKLYPESINVKNQISTFCFA